ncbi:excinuclease ABC subunit UvrC [Exilibacterium tricleocarpae]|uniref:UvrABC system protein C n=1 Tax=Exilibacterium tricleocarpae TaxID=2591008 RepID=A0A545TVR6_9GAMM|nr:excinuclease ABC subunit UvrC [Exilibacterium tricleocarpae]TQV81317.1 excinuclease ABC subunit UvrC [Exilibacterium tricleocarpae]
MSADKTATGFDSKTFLKTLTRHPGVYQMYDGAGKILYVGKAKNLKNRLSSYFQKSGLPVKTAALVARIHHVEVTVAPSEAEALVLEQNLIKAQRPPFNILLRDDKSYPYIFVSKGEDFPRIGLHRGAKKRKGEYYGPFPNVGAVRESLSFLQKVFRVRQCDDSVFRNRQRPCLQYQIKRCNAPCVGLVTPAEYAEDVRRTEMFLQGKNQVLMREMADAMERAAAELAFEQAAVHRDQIAALQKIQTQQIVEEGSGDVDVIALAREATVACVQVLYIRQGRILGSKSYFPQPKLAESEAEVLAEFIPQFYLGSRTRDLPREVLLSHDFEGTEVIVEAIRQQRHKVLSFHHRLRSHRAKWLNLAANTARQNLAAHLATKQSMLRRYELLQDALGLEEMPQRLECFDISHSGGELTVASCVVFDQNGPVKSDYRRFNIDGIIPGDDYGAMEQALTRRYTRLQEGEGKLPDILFIDGGKGQLSQAQAVLAELGVSDVNLIGVAKGTTRKAGFETLFIDERQGGGHYRERVLDGDSPALHLIQQIRDEAHRFAVTGHKQRRDKQRRTSSLEQIPGVGPKRRRELLRFFGGLQEVSRASADELAKVPSISKKMAEDIYSALHSE